mmetsp:Transcript_61945/g.191969  ORF Transcript_61945/g.191969 Transcript_61945/m.191969 type:complete len:348 (-) Transcript_61945:231-1274(-)
MAVVAIARVAVVAGLALPCVCATAVPGAVDLLEDSVHLLQTHYKLGNSLGSSALATPPLNGHRDLALVHVPFNFGHTVEKVAAWGSGSYAESKFDAAIAETVLAGLGAPKPAVVPAVDDVAWGFLNPMLSSKWSNVTGCPLYLTPPKYWPKSIADAYFAAKTPFGLLRDPYERLVAFFRGNITSYGGGYGRFLPTCDVNGAVKQMMRDQLSSTDPFRESCTFLPQAEYYDGPHGIALPVDLRRFPESMNEVFVAHGYPEMQIKTLDSMHVDLCNEVWSADLDSETRAMVRQVYRRDFDLLCKHFGHCDTSEDTCIVGVPQMCPKKVLAVRALAAWLPSMKSDSRVGR